MSKTIRKVNNLVAKHSSLAGKAGKHKVGTKYQRRTKHCSRYTNDV